MKILFVEPDFPTARKSKNHKDFLPIGLLKLYNYYRDLGYNTKLIRGNIDKRKVGTRFKPDKIFITSLFTYWSKYVWETVSFYRKKYHDAEIVVGGIYASLMGDHPSFKIKLKKYNAKVYFGIHKKAEKYAANFKLNYSILDNASPIDYQIIHTSRGCPRKCKFCGTWKIEPQEKWKKSISKEIQKRKIVFYDNNLLLNPFIENILQELIELKKKKKILWCESQSGFDGRVLKEKPYLAPLVKQAGFRNARIAWDGQFKQYNKIKQQLDILAKSGYNYKDISIFMLYNWKINFEEMEQKRIKCWEWNVQVADCRFRPLDQEFDEYNPLKKPQSSKEYYIHEKWNDSLVRQFRKNVRQHNICVRQNLIFYSKVFERKKANKGIIKRTKKMSKYEVKQLLNNKNIDFWFPEDITYPEKYLNQLELKKLTILNENANRINLKGELSTIT